MSRSIRKPRRLLVPRSPRNAELPVVPERASDAVSTDGTSSTADTGDMEDSIKRMIEAAYT
jgi:hypothetical protein